MPHPIDTDAGHALNSPPMRPDTKNGLSLAEAKTMADWTRQDLASGKISKEQADAIFADLNTPMEDRALDTRTPQQKQLDTNRRNRTTTSSVITRPDKSRRSSRRK